MNVMLVQAKLCAFYNSMDGAGGNMDISIDADSRNITGVGCEGGPTKEDAILVLAEAYRMLVPAMDGETPSELVVRDLME
jgi:hypothetical protein